MSSVMAQKLHYWVDSIRPLRMTLALTRYRDLLPAHYITVACDGEEAWICAGVARDPRRSPRGGVSYPLGHPASKAIARIDTIPGVDLWEITSAELV